MPKKTKTKRVYEVPPDVLYHPTQNAQNLENLIANDLRHLASVVPSHGPQLEQPKPRRYHINPALQKGEPLPSLTPPATSSTPVVRYSKSCTACLTQGFKCSGHKPICSQCYNSSSRYAQPLVRQNQQQRQQQQQQQQQQQTQLGGNNSNNSTDHLVGFSKLDRHDTDGGGDYGPVMTCSYPVEGTPLLPGYLFKSLTSKELYRGMVNPVDYFDRRFDKATLTKAIRDMTMVPIKDRNDLQTRASLKKDHAIDGPSDAIKGEKGDPNVDGEMKQDESGDLRRWEFHYPTVPTIDRNPASAVDYLLQGQMRLEKFPGYESLTYRRFLRKYKAYKHASDSPQDPTGVTTSDNEIEPRRDGRQRGGEEEDDELDVLGEPEDEAEEERSPSSNGGWVVEQVLADDQEDDEQPMQGTTMINWMPMTGEDSAVGFVSTTQQERRKHAKTMKRDRTILGLSRENQETLLEQSNGVSFHNEISLANWAATSVKANENWNGVGSKTNPEIEQEIIEADSTISPIKSHRRSATRIKKKKGLRSEEVPKYRKRMNKTFRPWVADKGDWVNPSACDIPETSFLQALHFYASYYYTHVRPCPDVFESMDLTSHIALGMIIQETISDFAFKLGKEGQMEDMEVHVAKRPHVNHWKMQKQAQSDSERENTDMYMFSDQDEIRFQSEQEREKGKGGNAAITATETPPRVRSRFGRSANNYVVDDEENSFDEEEEYGRNIRRPGSAIEEDYWPPQSLEEVRLLSEVAAAKPKPKSKKKETQRRSTDADNRKEDKMEQSKREKLGTAAKLLEKQGRARAPQERNKTSENDKAQGTKRSKKSNNKTLPSPLKAASPILTDMYDVDDEEEEDEPLIRYKRPREEEMMEEEEEEEEEEEPLIRHSRKRRPEEKTVEKQHAGNADAAMSVVDSEDDNPGEQEMTPVAKRQSVEDKLQDENSVLASIDSDIDDDYDDDDDEDDDVIASEHENDTFKVHTVEGEKDEQQEEQESEEEQPAWTPVASTRFGSLFDRSHGHDDDDDEDEDNEGGSSSRVVSQVVVDDTTTDEEDVIGPSEVEESDEY